MESFLAEWGPSRCFPRMRPSRSFGTLNRGLIEYGARISNLQITNFTIPEEVNQQRIQTWEAEAAKSRPPSPLARRKPTRSGNVRKPAPKRNRRSSPVLPKIWKRSTSTVCRRPSCCPFRESWTKACRTPSQGFGHQRNLGYARKIKETTVIAVLQRPKRSS